MLLEKNEIRSVWQSDRRREKKHLCILLLTTAAVFLFCLCFRYNAYFFEDKFVPAAYFKSYVLAIRLLFSKLFGGQLYLQREALIEACDSVVYYGALAQLKITFMALVSGGALALSGAVFQTCYRNPMASPNLIGASAGVGLGNVVVVMLFSVQAVDNVLLRYGWCYGLSAVCVLLVLLLGKLAGRRDENDSVIEMVMAGSIVSQLLRVFTMYFMYNLEAENLILYEQLSLGTYLQYEGRTLLIFTLVMVVSLIPVLLLRYRMNAVGMDRAESAGLGISTGGLRLVGQVCGVLMMVCSMVHCGEIGMLSLVVPYAVRSVFGADFRKVSVYSMLIGGIFVMLCRLLTSFIFLVNTPIPITFIIELVLMPVFMVILAKNRRAVYEA